MDLKSKLRAIVQPPRRAPGEGETLRELTYEPDTGSYEAGLSIDRVCEQLGGRPARNAFGQCLVIDRRYESDRWHGDVKIGECELEDWSSLGLLEPGLSGFSSRSARTVFIDLETTGLSGGAGTVAFLVGCGYYDLGAFQVRQFLLTSHSAERALLTAVAEFFDDANLIVTYNGKTFDVPVMETRWSFHRMEMPLDGVPHFDALHTARRLWKVRGDDSGDGGCRLSTLERTLFDVRRVGDVGGFEIPSRFFHFMRTGDARPLEPVLEHNRLDLVSLAAVTARAVQLAQAGADGCPDEQQALALGRIYERAGMCDRAELCFRRAANSPSLEIKIEALYRLSLRCRRSRRFDEAVSCWQSIVAVTGSRSARRNKVAAALREFAVEALAIHQEHRERDLTAARELALFALDEGIGGRRADSYRHRLARLDRKLARKENPQLFSS
jgi:uncharacterized protein YprB with RNaseH-like and TPR domain